MEQQFLSLAVGVQLAISVWAQEAAGCMASRVAIHCRRAAGVGTVTTKRSNGVLPLVNM